MCEANYRKVEEKTYSCVQFSEFSSDLLQRHQTMQTETFPCVSLCTVCLESVPLCLFVCACLCVCVHVHVCLCVHLPMLPSNPPKGPSISQTTPSPSPSLTHPPFFHSFPTLSYTPKEGSSQSLGGVSKCKEASQEIMDFLSD